MNRAFIYAPGAMLVAGLALGFVPLPDTLRIIPTILKAIGLIGVVGIAAISAAGQLRVRRSKGSPSQTPILRSPFLLIPAGIFFVSLGLAVTAAEVSHGTSILIIVFGIVAILCVLVCLVAFWVAVFYRPSRMR